MLQQMILRTSRYNINNINHRTTHWVRFFGASSAASTVSTSDLKGSNTQTTEQQRPIRISLPTFGQNGTLLLRNNNSINNISKVQIIPQWRDDALIELLPLSVSENDENGSSAEEQRDDHTEIATFGTSTESSSLETTVQTFGPLQITNHAEGKITSLGRKGSYIEVNILFSNSLIKRLQNFFFMFYEYLYNQYNGIMACNTNKP